MLLHAVAFAVAGAANAACAWAGPHSGLLNNDEMRVVLTNARNTQNLLLPEQQLSSCWPYDAASSDNLTGTALCTVSTPHLLNGSVRFVRGPDLLCSYTHDEFCDVRQPQ
ncbi:MAG: hypothetical protein KGO53_07695 [Alphaproteobacteria bacterium]|nr:hypothetical protein [Alphaproteobacteria bacterium]